MNVKFKNATKRIAVIAASAALIAGGAFATSLSNYPTNFVQNGQFNGQVVVGASAQAIDTTSASMLITSLKNQFAGNSQNMVKISYQTQGAVAQQANVAQNGKSYSYGSDFNSARGSAVFTSTDLGILANGVFNYGSSSTSYTQQIKLAGNQGNFEYALRNNLESGISSQLYFNTGDLMNYTLQFSTPISGSAISTLPGQSLNIMGQQFTVTSVSGTNWSSSTTMTLIGGGTKVSLTNGQSTTVKQDGTSYVIKVVSIGTSGTTSNVLVDVNGQSQTLQLGNNQNIGGVNVAVTDAIVSSNNNANSYVELVVGGQRITLGSGTLQINGQDVSTVFPGYQITSNLDTTGGTLNDIVINYGLNNEMILKSGQSFKDPIFKAFALKFNGANNVSYSTYKLTPSGQYVTLNGNLVNGNSFNQNIAKLTPDHQYVRLIGQNDQDSMLVSTPAFGNPTALTLNTSSFSTTLGLEFNLTSQTNLDINGRPNVVASTGTTNLVFGNYAINYTSNGSLQNVSVNGISLNNAKANGFRFLAGTNNVQSLYQIQNYVASPSYEANVLDLLNSNSVNNIKVSSFQGRLTNLQGSFGVSNTTLGLVDTIGASALTSNLAMADNGLVDLSNVNNLLASSKVVFNLNSQNIATSGVSLLENISVKLGYDSTYNKVTVNLDSASTTSGLLIPTNGGQTEISTGNSNTNQYVTDYGTKVTYENNAGTTYVNVAVPNKLVQANVYLTTASAVGSTETVTVPSSQVTAKKASLQSAGYTITGTAAVSNNPTTFSVTAPVLDSKVTGDSNMIVVGGPAVNSVARALLGITSYTPSQAGVSSGQGVIKYYQSQNSVLVYGYSGKDTQASVSKLNSGNLTGNTINVQG